MASIDGDSLNQNQALMSSTWKRVAYSIWFAGLIGGLAVFIGRIIDVTSLYTAGHAILAFVVTMSVVLLIAQPWKPGHGRGGAD
ncbi:hypothetical protein AYO47_05345 [Planctomyces sp. SCGC AG-212-M04]|nr:hypothetical protein AYO47_05345 [Planctomyces sp. SCGC AG-212-M04]